MPGKEPPHTPALNHRHVRRLITVDTEKIFSFDY
jgi:hypothetical protein